MNKRTVLREQVLFDRVWNMEHGNEFLNEGSMFIRCMF